MFQIAMLRVDKQFYEASLAVALADALGGRLSDAAGAKTEDYRRALEAIDAKLLGLGIPKTESESSEQR